MRRANTERNQLTPRRGANSAVAAGQQCRSSRLHPATPPNPTFVGPLGRGRCPQFPPGLGASDGSARDRLLADTDHADRRGRTSRPREPLPAPSQKATVARRLLYRLTATWRIPEREDMINADGPAYADRLIRAARDIPMSCADLPGDRSLRQGSQCSCAQLLMLRRSYPPAPARGNRAGRRHGAAAGDPGPAPDTRAPTSPARPAAALTGEVRPRARRPSLTGEHRTPEDGTGDRRSRRATNDAITSIHSARSHRGNTRAGRRVHQGGRHNRDSPGSGADRPRQHILRRADRARSGAGGARYSHLGTSGTGRRDSASGNEGNMTC